MKKVFVILAGFVLFSSCSNNDGQTGVMNDGMKLGDTNGGLADTARLQNHSGTDTAAGEHRVDISTRDTFKTPAQR